MPPSSADRSALENAKKKAFDAQDGNYKKLLKLLKHSAEDVYGQEEIRKAMSRNVRLTIGCMDPRVVPSDGWKKIAIAGSTVLLNARQRETFAGHLKHARVRIEEVTYHQGCGAALLRSKELSKEQPGTHEPEVIGKDAADSIIKSMELNLKPKRIGFEMMTGSPDFLSARAVIVDMSGWLNRTLIPLPVAFELTAKYFPDEEQVLRELTIAMSLAFSDNGFGRHAFDTTMGEVPLAVIVVEDPANPVFSKEVEKRVKSLLESEYPHETILVPFRTHPKTVHHAHGDDGM